MLDCFWRRFYHHYVKTCWEIFINKAVEKYHWIWAWICGFSQMTWRGVGNGEAGKGATPECNEEKMGHRRWKYEKPINSDVEGGQRNGVRSRRRSIQRDLGGGLHDRWDGRYKHYQFLLFTVWLLCARCSSKRIPWFLLTKLHKIPIREILNTIPSFYMRGVRQRETEECASPTEDWSQCLNQGSLSLEFIISVSTMNCP